MPGLGSTPRNQAAEDALYGGMFSDLFSLLVLPALGLAAPVAGLWCAANDRSAVRFAPAADTRENVLAFAMFRRRALQEDRAKLAALGAEVAGRHQPGGR